MLILIDNRSGQPIYEQICAQIKGAILGGELPEHTPLPSIRGLAKDLKVSFITTKRAYEELEREGWIYTVPGKGCFVAAKNLEMVREERLREIEAHLEAAAALAAELGLSSAELEEMLRFSMEGRP
ncbi:MAG: GntR family transcriptional regulator [Oscillospiraceae bacterium]|nr:GntR family transcriptional regulator [Oscillospiraceae bacterium]